MYIFFRFEGKLTCTHIASQLSVVWKKERNFLSSERQIETRTPL